MKSKKRKSIIAVVDFYDPSKRLIKDTFEKADFAVVTSSTIQDALSLVKHALIQGIVVDPLHEKGELVNELVNVISGLQKGEEKKKVALQIVCYEPCLNAEKLKSNSSKVNEDPHLWRMMNGVEFIIIEKRSTNIKILPREMKRLLAR